MKEQRAAYTALLQNLGKASFEEIEAVMSKREEVQPEAGLSSETVARLQERLVSERRRAQVEVFAINAGLFERLDGRPIHTVSDLAIGVFAGFV